MQIFFTCKEESRIYNKSLVGSKKGKAVLMMRVFLPAFFRLGINSETVEVVRDLVRVLARGISSMGTSSSTHGG
jgi:hypothetical protein